MRTHWHPQAFDPSHWDDRHWEGGDVTPPSEVASHWKPRAYHASHWRDHHWLEVESEPTPEPEPTTGGKGALYGRPVFRPARLPRPFRPDPQPELEPEPLPTEVFRRGLLEIVLEPVARIAWAWVAERTGNIRVAPQPDSARLIRSHQRALSPAVEMVLAGGTRWHWQAARRGAVGLAWTPAVRLEVGDGSDVLLMEDDMLLGVDG